MMPHKNNVADAVNKSLTIYIKTNNYSMWEKLQVQETDLYEIQ